MNEFDELYEKKRVHGSEKSEEIRVHTPSTESELNVARRKNIVIYILAILVVAGLLVMFCFRESVSDIRDMIFMSNSDLLTKVVEDELESDCKVAGSEMALFKQEVDAGNKTSTLDVKFYDNLLTNSLWKENIEQENGSKKSFRIESSEVFNTNGVNIKSNIRLDEMEIFSVNTAYDSEGGCYLGAPDFADSYLYLSEEDLAKYMLSTPIAVEKKNDLLSQLLLSMELKELLNKYTKMAVEQVGEIEREKTSYEMRGKRIGCQGLSFELDSKKLDEMTVALATELKNDEEFQGLFVCYYPIFRDYCGFTGQKAGAAYQQVLTQLDDLIASANKRLKADNYPKMKNYKVTVLVNRKAKIKGFVVADTNFFDNAKPVIEFKRHTDKKTEYFEMNFSKDENCLKVTGDCEKKDHIIRVFNSFEYNEQKLGNVFLNISDTKADEKSFDLSVYLDEDFQLEDYNVSPMLAKVLNDSWISFDYREYDDMFYTDFRYFRDEETILSVTDRSTIEKNPNVQINLPQESECYNAFDSEKVQEFYEKLLTEENADSLFEKMEKCGFSADAIDYARGWYYNFCINAPKNKKNED